MSGTNVDVRPAGLLRHDQPSAFANPLCKALSLIVFVGFYPLARRANEYADVLAQALRVHLVLLHVTRASLFDGNNLMAEGYLHRNW